MGDSQESPAWVMTLSRCTCPCSFLCDCQTAQLFRVSSSSCQLEEGLVSLVSFINFLRLVIFTSFCFLFNFCVLMSFSPSVLDILLCGRDNYTTVSVKAVVLLNIVTLRAEFQCVCFWDTSKDGESAMNEGKMVQFLPGMLCIKNQIKPGGGGAYL